MYSCCCIFNVGEILFAESLFLWGNHSWHFMHKHVEPGWTARVSDTFRHLRIWRLSRKLLGQISSTLVNVFLARRNLEWTACRAWWNILACILYCNSPHHKRPCVNMPEEYITESLWGQTLEGITIAYCKEMAIYMLCYVVIWTMIEFLPLHVRLSERIKSDFGLKGNWRLISQFT